jgi:circadian clock protein KaiC
MTTSSGAASARGVPRLVAAEHRQPTDRTRLASGLTQPILSWAAAWAAPARRGGRRRHRQIDHRRAVCGSAAARRARHLFIFDESNTLFSRMAGLATSSTSLPAGYPCGQSIGRAIAREFGTGALRRGGQAFQHRGHRRLNGYLNSMPDERFMVVQLHELLTYLGQRGVATLLTAAQHGIIPAMSAPVMRAISPTP